jgi:ArsR family transcriptional regulator, lead/cadmium/zinc/bismuth-responsive transcriptional repressor
MGLYLTYEQLLIYSFKACKMTNTTREDQEFCSCSIVHEEAVRNARSAEASAAELSGLAELFRLYADPTRLRILDALGTGELCVCDLAAVLGMTQSAVSHQLATLRHARLVRTRKDGKVVYYTLDDGHVGGIVELARTHMNEVRSDYHG